MWLTGENICPSHSESTTIILFFLHLSSQKTFYSVTLWLLISDKLWYCRLSPNHKVLHYGDIEEETETPSIESLQDKSECCSYMSPLTHYAVGLPKSTAYQWSASVCAPLRQIPWNQCAVRLSQGTKWSEPKRRDLMLDYLFFFSPQFLWQTLKPCWPEKTVLTWKITRASKPRSISRFLLLKSAFISNEIFCKYDLTGNFRSEVFGLGIIVTFPYQIIWVMQISLLLLLL